MASLGAGLVAMAGLSSQAALGPPLESAVPSAREQPQNRATLSASDLSLGEGREECKLLSTRNHRWFKLSHSRGRDAPFGGLPSNFLWPYSQHAPVQGRPSSKWGVVAEGNSRLGYEGTKPTENVPTSQGPIRRFGGWGRDKRGSPREELALAT